MIDNSQYQTQVVAALRSIATALSGGVVRTGSVASGTQQAASVSPLATRLDSLVSVMDRLTTTLQAALFITVPAEDPEEDVQVSIAQLVAEIRDSLNPATEDSLAEAVAKITASVYDDSGQDPVTILSALDDIKEEINTGDANIVSALTGTDGINDTLDDIYQAVGGISIPDYSTVLGEIETDTATIAQNTTPTP